MEAKETYVILHCKEGDNPPEVCGLFANEMEALAESARATIRYMLATGREDLSWMAETRDASEIRNLMAALDASAMIQQDPVLRLIHQLGI